MNKLGTHLIIEFYECDAALLDDHDFIKETMVSSAKRAGATIVSSHMNRFKPHGLSGVVVIAESHLTIHTWPELKYAAVDIFTCGESISPSKVKEILKKSLKSKRCEAKEFDRGVNLKD